MMKFAVGFGAPVAVRYPRGEAYDGLKEYRAEVIYGKSEFIYKEKDICLLAVGSMVKTACQVRSQLKEKGYSCSIVNARFVKPIDEDTIKEALKEHTLFVTMEENVASGGYGEKVRKLLNQERTGTKLVTVAIPDEYVEHGNVEILRKEMGLDADSVTERILAEYCG